MVIALKVAGNNKNVRSTQAPQRSRWSFLQATLGRQNRLARSKNWGGLKEFRGRQEDAIHSVW